MGPARFLSGVVGTESWRYLFLVGVVPALFVLFLRRTAEPATDEREDESGNAGEAVVPVSDLVSRSLRRRVVLGSAVVFAATAGWWGTATWIPLYAGDVAEGAGLANPGLWSAVAGVCYGIGGIVGYATVEPIADRVGRVGSLLLLLVGSLVSVPALYLVVATPLLFSAVAAVVGYVTLGQFGWAHVYLSELFPRAARTTALEAVHTLARLVAVVVPVLVGFEIATFDATTSVVATVAVLYAVGILAALFLPSGMDRPVAEQDAP